MDFTESWQWPQWVAAAWMILKLCLGAVMHGKPRTEQNISFPISLVQCALILFLLIPGGFFA